MAKTEKVKSTKGAKPGVARTKVSRVTKLERKLVGTSAKTPFSMKSGVFTVTGFQQAATEIAGYLVERSETHTVFRHKVSNASKKMVVSVFPNEIVLEQVGKVGEVGSVTVRLRKPFTSVEGTVKFDGATIVVTSEDGTVSRFNAANGDYEIKALDVEGSQASARGRTAGEKTVKGDKKAKVTDIKDGKKKSKK